TYELTDVPVHFLCPPDFPWRPRFGSPQVARVNLKVMSPTADEAPSMTAYVDLTRGEFTPGRNKEPLRVQLPRDAQLAQDVLPLITFYLDPIEPAATGLRGD